MPNFVGKEGCPKDSGLQVLEEFKEGEGGDLLIDLASSERNGDLSSLVGKTVFVGAKGNETFHLRAITEIVGQPVLDVNDFQPHQALLPVRVLASFEEPRKVVGPVAQAFRPAHYALKPIH